jgi:hypothetical protein
MLLIVYRTENVADALKIRDEHEAHIIAGMIERHTTAGAVAVVRDIEAGRYVLRNGGVFVRRLEMEAFKPV